MPRKPAHVKELPVVREFLKISQDIWLKGWAERNAGNASIRLAEGEIRGFIDTKAAVRSQPISTAVPELAGDYYLITGTGKYFRNIKESPEENIGVIRIDESGAGYRILWGLEGDGLPTSELSAHLLTHLTQRRAGREGLRVLLHTHPTNLIALSFVLELDTKVFTRRLWEMNSECIIFFPDGVGVLPWGVPGSEEIGRDTARLMERHRLVLWPFHGIWGAGSTLDETFGMIDTAEKAAEVLVKVLSMGGARQAISDSQLLELCRQFRVTPMEGILSSGE